MARLLANIPLLQAGYPPLVIQRTYAVRERYIRVLQTIQQQIGTLTQQNHPIPIAEEIQM